MIDAAGVEARALDETGAYTEPDEASLLGVDHVPVQAETSADSDHRMAEVHELHGERERDDGHAYTNGAAPAAEAQPRNTTGLDTEALRETLALVGDRIDELGSDFYAQLFALAPETREMFGAGMAVQRSRLLGALVHIVGTADDRDDLVPYLEGLGRDHRKFGVIDQHYAPVGSALILALRNMLGIQWTPRHEQAWIQAYDWIATTMSGAAQRDAVIAPPWWDAEVVYHRRVLDDLAVIQVRPHTDYPYRPGQYAYLTTPRRPKIWRAYSMASAPRDDGLLEFHVRTVGAGWVSSALVWRTEPGDVLHVGAPQGHDIASPRSESDLLCITGGTGIAPILATLQELEQRQDGRRVHVFYAGRDRDSLYALPHLESIGVRYRRLTVVPVVSPEGPTDRSPHLMGNIVSAYGDWRRHRVYVAGPSSMVSTSIERLREQGVAEDQIVFDDYGLW
ncbi:globin domain-containing protein [Haloactinopolyspora alba]|uniref:globin domain-containing protein n=1 Tax=Haloactinopolyspora alba TaxID=648780 RepID=UPI0013EC5167|nr:globin domain-containing protein [Haloactinopolyspora alba]